MQEELNRFIQEPYDDATVFNLANCYYNIGQTSSALGLYLRITEYSKNDLLVYESLLKSGLCLRAQKDRNIHVKALFMHAISVLPRRPEAYFLLARLYEERSEWCECYSMACTALSIANETHTSLLTDVEYPGPYGFIFEKAVSSWWMGRNQESLDTFLFLDKIPMSDAHTAAVKANIASMMGTPEWTDPAYHRKNRAELLRLKFPGYDTIQANYSQCFQDMFILMATQGKKNGKYLEIGSNVPFAHNNTAILETEFDWKGISVEIDWNLVSQFRGSRKNDCICADATTLDYSKVLDDANMGTDWDYLQLDCEPPNNTYLALLSIPLEKYRFAVITYEHEFYCDETKSYRDKSRRYLKAHGYELIVDNVAIDDKSPFEDWWCHPDLISKKVLDALRCVGPEVKKAEKYIYNL